MIEPKEYILSIINEGIESAQALKDEAIKEKVILMFKRLSDFIKDSNKSAQILDLARKLSISVMEAIDFIDYEELERAVVSVYEDIERLN